MAERLNNLSLVNLESHREDLVYDGFASRCRALHFDRHFRPRLNGILEKIRNRILDLSGKNSH